MLPWRASSRGSGSHGSLSGSFGKSSYEKERSNVLSWRKEFEGSKEGLGGSRSREEKEVTSPLKPQDFVPRPDGELLQEAKKKLFDNTPQASNVHSDMQEPVAVKDAKNLSAKKRRAKRDAQKGDRSSGKSAASPVVSPGTKKRLREEGSGSDVEDQKKAKKGDVQMAELSSDNTQSAGPTDQSCES